MILVIITISQSGMMLSYHVNRIGIGITVVLVQKQMMMMLMVIIHDADDVKSDELQLEFH